MIFLLIILSSIIKKRHYCIAELEQISYQQRFLQMI